MPRIKQRKALRIFKYALSRANIDKHNDIDGKIKTVVNAINKTINDRIRAISLIDYYLKHINDENQLKNMDRLIKEMAVCAILNEKQFNKSFLNKVKFIDLKNAGLPSLLHRHRLIAHGHIKINFFDLISDYKLNRLESKVDDYFKYSQDVVGEI